MGFFLGLLLGIYIGRFWDRTEVAFYIIIS